MADDSERITCRLIRLQKTGPLHTGWRERNRVDRYQAHYLSDARTHEMRSYQGLSLSRAKTAEIYFISTSGRLGRKQTCAVHEADVR